jgi:hypothetical protein
MYIFYKVQNTNTKISGVTNGCVDFIPSMFHYSNLPDSVKDTQVIPRKTCI